MNKEPNQAPPLSNSETSALEQCQDLLAATRNREAALEDAAHDLLELWDESMILTKPERDAFERLKEVLDANPCQSRASQ